MTIENGKFVIRAVHERDAEKFWKKLGLKEVEKCFICERDVTWRNFGAVSPWVIGNQKGIIVICESSDCFFEFNIMRRDKMIESPLDKEN